MAAQTTVAHNLARIVRANASARRQSIEWYAAEAIQRMGVEDADALVLFLQAIAIIAIENFMRGGRPLHGGAPEYVLGVAVQR